MASQLLDPITITAGSDKYVTLYLQDTDKLLLYFSITFAAPPAGVGVTATLANGYGRKDTLIPYPSSQPVPLVLDSTGLTITAASYGITTLYTMQAPAGSTQVGEIWVDMTKVGDYLQIKLSNTEAVTATVTISAKVS